MAENDGVVDVTILGAGPVGLSASYYLGHRDGTVRIVESLEQIGGQVAATYPEKHVYDVAGFPKILGQKLVDMCAEQGLQYGADVRLGEEAKGARAGESERRGAARAHDRQGQHLPVPRDDHHRRPRRLRAPQARHRGDRRVAGTRAPLRRSREGPVRGQAVRDRGRRRLCARLDPWAPGHGRPSDHARPPARSLPRARVVHERSAAAGRRGGPSGS